MAAHSADHIACVVHFDCLHEKDLKVFSKVTEKSLEKIKEVISCAEKQITFTATLQERQGIHCLTSSTGTK
jgi:hypothetical protein